MNLTERKTGGLGAGGGLSTQSRGEGALPGFVGSFSYAEKNLFGLNQRLAAQVELGQVTAGVRGKEGRGVREEGQSAGFCGLVRLL